MDKALLSLRNVSFSYSKERVVDDVSFDIRKGELIGVAGPNGAGKTTLLKLIIGLLKPSSGRIETPASGRGAVGGVGYLPQSAQGIDMNFPATVKEVVGMGLYGRRGVFKRLGGADNEAIDKAMENVGMSRLKDRQISMLSGGQLQRALIARAMVAEPSLLVLDEPTSAVDLSGEEAFYRLVSRINKVYGVAVLLVSHDVYSLMEHTNRLLFMNRRLLYDGKSRGLGNGKLLRLLFSHKHSRETIRLLERGLVGREGAGQGSKEAKR